MEKDAIKTYYSTSPSLQLRVSAGEVVMKAGQIERVGEKFAEFSPIGDGYGVLHTPDPEIQAFLDKQLSSGRPDIFPTSEYIKRITPPEETVMKLEEMVADLQRRIQTNNALVAKLGAGEAVKSK